MDIAEWERVCSVAGGVGSLHHLGSVFVSASAKEGLEPLQLIAAFEVICIDGSVQVANVRHPIRVKDGRSYRHTSRTLPHSP